MSKLVHLWHSKKQAKDLASQNRSSLTGRLEDGATCIFTEARSQKAAGDPPQPGGKWDDYTYLGLGQYVGPV